ncbi:MAG: transglutaminase TgpA family protein [Geodermatophilaceae bacterium]
MTVTSKLSLAGAVGVLLGALSLEPVFVNLSWLLPVVLVLAAILALSLGIRRVPGLAPWAPLFEMAGAMLVLTALFASGRAFLGFVPTWASVADMRVLLADAGYAVRTQVSPAQTLDELLFLAAIGVGVVAVAVDILAVSLRRPAVAGLALLVLYAIPTASLVEGIPWWPFVGAAVGYLLLLFVDGRETMLRWGRRADDGPSTPTFGLLASQRIGALAIAAGLALPLLIPSLPSGILRTVGNGIGDGPGTSLNPLATLAGDLTLPEPVDLLRVETNVDDPYYLRAVSLETYTDQGWAPGNLDGTFDANDGDLLGPPEGSPTRRVQAQIEVLDQDSRFLSTYYSTRDIDSEGDWRFDEISGTVWSENDRTGGLTYSVEADEPVPTVDDLENADDLDSDDQVQRRFTDLPPLVRPEVATLVQNLTDNAEGPYARTIAIMDFFTDPANRFIYSLVTEPGTSGDKLVDFLTNRRGYCEQYAAAMGVMLRFANVPARVVLGYTPGDKNAGRWTVTTDDAHAWVEAYFEGIGWVPFDPTPLGGGRGVESPWAPRVDSEASNPTSTGPNPSGTATGQAPTGVLEPNIPIGPDSNAGGTDSGLLNPVATLIWLAVALVVGLVVTPAALRLTARRGRLRAAAAGGVTAAHSAWDEMLATAADLGASTPRAETPRAVARRLAREHSFDKAGGDAIRLLATAEERARYAPASHAQTEGDLAAATRIVTKAISQDASRRDRVRAVLLPSSSLRRMAQGLEDMRGRTRARWRSMRTPQSAHTGN